MGAGLGLAMATDVRLSFQVTLVNVFSYRALILADRASSRPTL